MHRVPREFMYMEKSVIDEVILSKKYSIQYAVRCLVWQKKTVESYGRDAFIILLAAMIADRDVAKSLTFKIHGWFSLSKIYLLSLLCHWLTVLGKWRGKYH